MSSNTNVNADTELYVVKVLVAPRSYHFEIWWFRTMWALYLDGRILSREQTFWRSSLG